MPERAEGGAAGTSPDQVEGEDQASDLASIIESPLVNGTATKLKILNELDVRKMTAPEVSRRLDMDRAGIYRHLEALTEHGFVDRLETERKWIYYSLTKKGRLLLSMGSGITLGVILIAGALTCAYLVSRYLAAQPAGTGGGLVDPVSPPAEPSFPILALGVTISVTVLLALANRFIAQTWRPSRRAGAGP